MRPTALARAPRADVEDAGAAVRLAGWIGAGAIALYVAAGRRARAIVAAEGGACGPATLRDLLVRQIFLSGVKALPVVCAIAIGGGSAIVLQTGIMAPPPSGELGRLLVVVVLRELTPTVTAIVSAGISGAVVAAEMRALLAEAPAGRRAGLVAACMGGAAISMLVLTVYFGVIATVAGYLVSQLLTLRTFDAVQAGFHQELSALDLPFFVAKSAGLGAIVGWSACRRGPGDPETATDAARDASRTFVWTLMGCLFYGGAVTVIFYALRGPPLPP